MSIPLAYLDAAAIEEVPITLWRHVFDVIGWPVSLSGRSGQLTHDDVVESFARDETTDDLLQLVEAVHTLGTPAGADAIQMALDDQHVAGDVLPRATSDRERAVHLYLLQRQNPSLVDVFVRAEIQVQARGDHRRYNEFVGRDPRSIGRLDARQRELTAAVRGYCTANDLGDYVHVRALAGDGVHVFQILRSHRTKKPLALVEGRDARAPLPYRPIHADLLQYDATLGRLRIAAQSASMVGFYRRTLGLVLFKDGDFFSADQICSLQVLQDRGRAVLDQHNVLGISRVRMTECVWDRGDRARLHLRASDCFSEIDKLRLPITEGTLVEAKLKLDVISGSTRPVSVSIRVPGRIEISQRRHEALVDRFLTEIGIRGRPSTGSTPTLWSLSPWRHRREVWRPVFGGETDRLIAQNVLRPVRLEGVPHEYAPAAGNTLGAVQLDGRTYYGVSDEPELASRTLTATDLDGYELEPERLRQLLRSDFGITGAATVWDGHDEVLDLGRVILGEQHLHLAYAIRRPTESVGARLRQRASGSPVVILCPSRDPVAVDAPTALLGHAMPTRAQAVRAAVAAVGMQDAVSAVFSAPDGARLVVDEARGMIFVDGVHVTGLKPETHAFRFVALLAQASGVYVESLDIKAALSGARPDEDTVTRQAKSKANREIRDAMAAAGREPIGDIFPTVGTGRYRCTLLSHVRGRSAS